MLIKKYNQSLRSVMNSKFVMKQSIQLPKVVQVNIKIKAENAYDSITNVSLLVVAYKRTGSIKFDTFSVLRG